MAMFSGCFCNILKSLLWIMHPYIYEMNSQRENENKSISVSQTKIPRVLAGGWE